VQVTHNQDDITNLEIGKPLVSPVGYSSDLFPTRGRHRHKKHLKKEQTIKHILQHNSKGVCTSLLGAFITVMQLLELDLLYLRSLFWFSLLISWGKVSVKKLLSTKNSSGNSKKHLGPLYQLDS
jgi:hypothetical protein